MPTISVNSPPPSRALVVPRGRVYGLDSELLPIETHVRALLRRHKTIALVGPSGSGKTTALAHLAALLGEHQIEYFDEPVDYFTAVLIGRPSIIAMSAPPGRGDEYAIVELAPWGESERIDYLLAKYPAQVRSVMERLVDSKWMDALEGSPRLWTAVLDRMAEVATLTDVPGMLRHVMNVVLAMFGDDAAYTRKLMATTARAHAAAPDGVPAFLKHPYMLRLALVEELIESIDQKPASDWWRRQWDDRVLSGVADRLRNDPPAIDRLRARLRQSSAATDGEIAVQAPMVTVMLAVDPTYRPTVNIVNFDLVGARGANWADAQLARVSLCNADLRQANLSGADLSNARAIGADLRQANLSGANLSDICLVQSQLDEASLPDAFLHHANLRRASAVTANFNNAQLQGTDLRRADLRGASFRSAELISAHLLEANLGAADFSFADLSKATGRDCDWRESILTEARFDEAQLHRAIFAEMQVDGLRAVWAQLVNADFTGSRFRAASFVSSNFRQAGLADIDWEGADLRGCDFTHAAFHMGSSRSGLVGSPIACEGSRTGFYTDDYKTQDFQPPEAIRKANLCGANLIDANVTGTDWYLVDLRSAKYSSRQAEWFRKCGAILANRA